MAGDRRHRPPAACQSMNLHVFSLCEHEPGLLQPTAWTPSGSKEPRPCRRTSSATRRDPHNWGDSVIEGGEIPVIVGKARITMLLCLVKGLNVIFWPHFGLWEECFEPVAGLRTRQGGAARMRGQALIRSRPASQDGARGRPANREQASTGAAAD